jgi:hypothetical protein
MASAVKRNSFRSFDRDAHTTKTKYQVVEVVVVVVV